MAYSEEEICELCGICNLTGNDYYDALMDCLVNYPSYLSSSSNFKKVGATATIIIGPGMPSPCTGPTPGFITITSTDGLEIDYTADVLEIISDNKFLAGCLVATTVDLVAASLANCIRSSTGHNGKIHVSLSGGGTGKMTLTQIDPGVAGNTSIKLGYAITNVTVTNFSGGIYTPVPAFDKELYITNLSPKFKGTKYDPRIAENNINIRGYTEEEYMELFPYVEKAIPGKPRIIDNYTDRLR